MDQSKLELVRMLTGLWKEGVRDPPGGVLRPALVLESPFSSVSSEPYRGHDGIERWMRDVDEQFSDWKSSHAESSEVGNTVISVGRLHGRGRNSGVEIDQPFATVVDFAADQRVSRVRIFWVLDAAPRAVGLAG